MLQTVQLPAGIAHLDTGLADMDGDTFTLKRVVSCRPTSSPRYLQTLVYNVVYVVYNIKEDYMVGAAHPLYTC